MKAEVTINKRVFFVHSVTKQTFRCGKTVSTVVLRAVSGNAELTLETSEDWQTAVGVSYDDEDAN